MTLHRLLKVRAFDRKLKTRLFQVLLALATLLTALFVNEIALRIVASRRLIYDIEMFRYAVQLKMPDPLGEINHVHRPNGSAKLMGVDISLNSLGNRGPEPDFGATPLRKKVLVIGGSIAMGWGVPYRDVFSTRAEELLNSKSALFRYSFFNSGVGNFPIYSRYTLFKRQYPIVKPDMVVFHYYVGDIDDHGAPRNNFLLRHSYLANFVLYRVLLHFTAEKRDLFSHYKALYFDDGSAWKANLGYLRRMRDQLAADHVPFVILMTPEIHSLEKGNPFEKLYAEIREQFALLEIPTLDSYAGFQECCAVDNRKIWVAPGDWHPNTVGHKIMAELVASYVLKNENRLWPRRAPAR